VRWDETYGGHLAGARAQATIFLLFPRDGASGDEDFFLGNDCYENYCFDGVFVWGEYGLKK
jgi:hypothetical protein